MSSQTAASLPSDRDQLARLNPLELPRAPNPSGDRARDGRVCLKRLVDAYEKSLIEVALVAAGGCQRSAAEVLGFLPSTPHQKLRRHGIPTARFGRRPEHQSQPASTPHELVGHAVDRGSVPSLR